MSKSWELMKLAFEYFSLGFQRIIFMILGAQIAFILCYAYWVQILKGTVMPLLPVAAGPGGDTIAGAMIVAGAIAVVYTIWTLLILAAVALIIGYVRHYLAVLSYYDEEKYAACKKYRAPRIPEFLLNFEIGKESERQRLAAIEDCRKKCKAIRECVE